MKPKDSLYLTTLRRCIHSAWVAALIFCCPTRESMAAEEPFAYPNGADIAMGAGGQGWANNWTIKAGNGNIQAVSGSLLHPGLTSSGNKMHCFWPTPATGTSTNVRRDLQAPLTSGTHYIRVIGQKLSGGDRFFGLALITPGGTEKCLIGQTSGYSVWTLNRTQSGEVFPIGHPNEGDPTNILSSAVPTSTQALLVVKLELEGPSVDNPNGLDKVTFWVNPDLSLPEDVSTAVGGQTFTTSIDFETIGRVRIGGGGFSATAGGEPAEHYLDEIQFDVYPPFAHGRVVVEQPLATPLVNNTAETDFGGVLLNQPSVLTYTVRNTGSGDLTDLAVQVTGTHAADFVAGTPGTSTLSPGGFTTFDVTFTPSALGVRSAAIELTSSDPVDGAFTVALAGVGAAPVIRVEQPAGVELSSGVSSTAFGRSDVGVPVAARTYTIKNTGDLPLSGLTAGVAGGQSADFMVSALTGTMVNPGDSVTFTVTFTPSGLGLRSTGLTISSNDPVTPSFEIGLTGQGGVPSLTVEQPVGVVLESGVSTVNFGGVHLIDPAGQRQLLLRNDGSSDLSDLALSITGLNAADFVVTSMVPDSLAPDADVLLTVQFAPSELGQRTALLTVRVMTR
jgi:hypothetical protein